MTPRTCSECLALVPVRGGRPPMTCSPACTARRLEREGKPRRIRKPRKNRTIGPRPETLEPTIRTCPGCLREVAPNDQGAIRTPSTHFHGDCFAGTKAARRKWTQTPRNPPCS